VAIDDGVITEVGNDVGEATREIDADGRIVAPGWVDVHTHYDGQVTWDPEMAPSSWHGVTSVVMGNCGVGFAPVRPGGQDFLVELMEAVEDIPGTALHEGIDWQWESFGEYLDALETMPRTLDVAAQMPHVALRAYVMGERAHEEPNADELAEMSRLTQQAIADGAIGFSTSRTILHKSKHGLIPGTHSAPDELIAIATGMAEAGKGIFQFVSDSMGSTEEEQAWVREIASFSGLTVTYSLAQSPFAPGAFREALDDASALAAKGVTVIPQVPARPTGMLFGLQSSFNPFMGYPSYRELWNVSLAERVAKLRDPEFRAQILSE
jgi:N-acyl-D-aspartate/D-glutamate deacylase